MTPDLAAAWADAVAWLTEPSPDFNDDIRRYDEWQTAHNEDAARILERIVQGTLAEAVKGDGRG